MLKEIIKIGQLEITFLLDAHQTNEQMTMFEVLIPNGSKVPLPHYHESYDETVYGLKGTTTFVLDHKTIPLNTGESIFIPRGVAHGFNNHTNQDSRFLAIVTPALVGPEYFKELAEIVNAGGPPDIEKIKVVFKKYGLVPILDMPV